MAWSLGEAAAQAARTYFNGTSGATTVLGAKCAAVAARHADGVLLPVPTAIRISDPLLEAEPQFPLLYISPERDAPQISATGLKRGWLLSSEVAFFLIYELSIDQSGSGISNAETMRLMGLRYIVAILECLADGITTMGIEWGTGMNPSAEYGATMTSKRRGVRRSSVLLRIGCVTSEAGL